MPAKGFTATGPRRLPALGGLVLLAVVALALPGCEGCRQTDSIDEKKPAAAKTKPKPDFERLRLAAQPGEGRSLTKSIKPGHWTSATVETRANNFDFRGELDLAATDTRGNLVDLEGTPFRLTTSRSAVLPKGQDRRLDAFLFVPGGAGTRSWIATELRDHASGREIRRETEVFSHMPGYQYFLLALVRQPDRYRWLKVIPSVRPPAGSLSVLSESRADSAYYRVELPHVAHGAPLPAEWLCWTTLAYIVWDDVDPTVLNAEQQQALLDWLHWGGQIILSGPRTLDLLKQGFLAPYLPATTPATRQLDGDALHELSAEWTIPRHGGQGLSAAQPWPGIALDKHPQAEFLPATGELVAERRVGRGRIVVTAFRLIERELLNWPSFDSFFNACLLRHPPRTYADPNVAEPTVDEVLFAGQRFDPELATRLRYFTRDAKPLADAPAAPPRGALVDPFSTPDENLPEATLASASVARWSDFGPVAAAARQALKQAAGITIPRRAFVVKVLLAYLVVLVPLNWALFWLLGRVEWAWIAAPLIAVACAVAVVWLAQLDIGFARAHTGIAVVELQSGYPRAHVTRYTALYSSLSTTYAIHLVEPSAAVLPFSTDPQFQLLAGQERRTVSLTRDQGVHLTGYVVASNSTGMIHSEYMADLGAVTLEEDEAGAMTVANQTSFVLREAAVLRRFRFGDRVDIAWLDSLEPAGRAALDWRPLDDDKPAPWREPPTAGEPPAGALSLQTLFQLAEYPSQLARGDVCLVARLDAELPGMRIEPAAAQQREATLLVAHLRYGADEAAEPDTNLPIAPRPGDDETDMPDETPATGTP